MIAAFSAAKSVWEEAGDAVGLPREFRSRFILARLEALLAATVCGTSILMKCR
jgi:hypothetical protein